MPLGWAHAEYVKLVRSIALGHPIDRPEAAWRRYRGQAPKATRAGRTLRLELMAPARVRYSLDGRQTWAEIDARETGLGVWVADVPGSHRLGPGSAVAFTF